MAKHKALVETAISIVGTQQKLAELIGLSQQGVSYLLNEADVVSAEVAIKIDRATGGKVSKEKLRPDLFGKAA